MAMSTLAFSFRVRFLKIEFTDLPNFPTRKFSQD